MEATRAATCMAHHGVGSAARSGGEGPTALHAGHENAGRSEGRKSACAGTCLYPLVRAGRRAHSTRPVYVEAAVQQMQQLSSRCGLLGCAAPGATHAFFSFSGSARQRAPSSLPVRVSDGAFACRYACRSLASHGDRRPRAREATEDTWTTSSPHALRFRRVSTPDCSVGARAAADSPPWALRDNAAGARCAASSAGVRSRCAVAALRAVARHGGTVMRSRAPGAGGAGAGA